jgi:hypothetical protein
LSFTLLQQTEFPLQYYFIEMKYLKIRYPNFIYH